MKWVGWLSLVSEMMLMMGVCRALIHHGRWGCRRGRARNGNNIVVRNDSLAGGQDVSSGTYFVSHFRADGPRP